MTDAMLLLVLRHVIITLDIPINVVTARGLALEARHLDLDQAKLVVGGHPHQIRVCKAVREITNLELGDALRLTRQAREYHDELTALPV